MNRFIAALMMVSNLALAAPKIQDADIKTNAAIQFSKLQDVSAQNRVLCRKSSGAGALEECSFNEILAFIGSNAQGDIIYFNGTNWVHLAAGTNGQFLQTQGSGANPQWATVSTSPPGSNTQVIYNDSGAYGADSGLVYNETTDALTAGFFNSPGAGSNSQRFGLGGLADGVNGLSIGNICNAYGGDDNICIGHSTSVGNPTAPSSKKLITGIGNNSGFNAPNSTGGIGIADYKTVVSEWFIWFGHGGGNITGNRVIGFSHASSACSFDDVILFAGLSGACTAASQLIFGSVDSPITEGYFGEGPVSTSPGAFGFNGTGGSGSNVAGGDVDLKAGKSTGNATPAKITFQTGTAGSSGATAQTLSTRARVVDSFQVAEQSAPSTPSSGFSAIYAKTDGKVYSKDDAGVEYDLTATGGGVGSCAGNLDNTDTITASGAGTFTVPTLASGVTCVRVLLVGGGGGGGHGGAVAGTGGGGGGGGSIRYADIQVQSGQVIKYNVGAGGAAGTAGGAGAAGGNTYFGSLVAAGGGGGSGRTAAGPGNGNSGGSSFGFAATNFAASTAFIIPSTNGIYDGGTGAGAYPGDAGSSTGGAGACAAGGNVLTGANTPAGVGGAGCSFTDPISAASTTYGGGGGGGTWNGTGPSSAPGGTGGGGAGGSAQPDAAVAGTANTGGGGGGGADSTAAAGGSGLIKIYSDQ